MGTNRRMLVWALGLVVFLSTLPGLARGDALPWEFLQLDVQGRTLYSRYNFTDLARPYDGLDTYVEIKPAVWFDHGHRVGLFASLMPVHATQDLFWWQRYAQAAIGLQVYPLDRESPQQALRGLRFFAQAAWRSYYDKPAGESPVGNDIQAGFDYYYESLFNPSLLGMTAFAYGAYRRTNFSLDRYDGLVTYGNVQGGPKTQLGPSLLAGFAVAGWSYSPMHRERWWENHLRLGAGIRWFPAGARQMGKQDRSAGNELLMRLQVFVEVLHNAAWLGETPSPPVERTDYRLGAAFSTGRFLNR